MENNTKKDIRALSLDQLKSIFNDMGEKAFRANQVYEWIWRKSAISFDEMSNLSKPLRDIISKKPILSVKFKSNDEILEAKIIDIVFSRELNRSPFIIEVDNKIIAPVKKDNKYMFYIGQKSDLSPNMLKAVVSNTKGNIP